MSKFKVSKREAHFSKPNVRGQNHGTEKVPAADFTITFSGSKRDIDMIFPLAEGEKFSDLAYTPQGAFKFPYVSPMPVHRKPDGLQIVIWDNATAKNKQLGFSECSAKNIEVTFHSKHKIEVSMMIQLEIDADRDAARIVRLMDQTREIEIVAAQDDLFSDPDDDEEPEEEQSDLAGKLADEEEDD